jgi:hypothetical protein
MISSTRYTRANAGERPKYLYLEKDKRKTKKDVPLTSKYIIFIALFIFWRKKGINEKNIILP